MAIPKIIHYCWFGDNPKTKLAKKCIKSWKRKCKDYQIIEWNEDNFIINDCPLYVRQAYEKKQWAFVADFVRLKVVYDNGGIYMDTDVQLIKSLNSLLNNTAYFGFEDGVHINTGLGFGAEKNTPILKELMDDYFSSPFIIENGEIDRTPCPVRNTIIFKKHGLIQDDSMQVLEKHILVLPSEYLCPLSYNTGKLTKSKKTISIHKFEASWRTRTEIREQRKRIRNRKLTRFLEVKHLPNRLLFTALGEERYNKLKKYVKANTHR